MVTKNKAIQLHSRITFEPEHNQVTIATLFSTVSLWEDWTTILLGDVNYGDSTISKIKKQQEKLMFYGTNKELFALKFHRDMHTGIIGAISHIISSKNFTFKFGKLWNLYRKINGGDFRVEKIDKYITFVADSRDFDTQKSYKRYAEKQQLCKQNSGLLP